MFRIAGGLLALVCAAGVSAQPHGIESRTPNTALVIDFEFETVPQHLSDIPALLQAGLGADQTVQGIFPYAPSSELWSDGALKSRFIALPGDAQIGFRNDAGWDFPVGTILIKNFLLPLDFRDPEGTAKRIETRLLVRTPFDWEGYTYEWNEDETDATLLAFGKQRPFNLVNENGGTFNYQWQYPSRQDCFLCHTAAANTALGLNTAQMNHPYDYPASGITDNQIRTFIHIGLFENPPPAAIEVLPRSPDAFDETAPLRDRALSYLQANCSHCHRPNGGTGVNMDLRWGIDIGARHLLNTPPTGTPMGIMNALRIAPGEPDRSVLPARMNTSTWQRMPPLATSRIHHAAVTLIRDWIASEGQPDGAPHSADQDGDFVITLSELLRVIQFFNTGAYQCGEDTEDGYAPGAGDTDCTPHDSDYNPQNWSVNLSELLRLVQLFNTGAYHPCPDGNSEDGFCPGQWPG